MTMSSAAYEAASSDEGRHGQGGKNSAAALHNHPGYSNHEASTEDSTKKKKRFSLLRRLSSKKPPADPAKGKKRGRKNRRFDPESSAPGIWPSGSKTKAGRRRSSLQSDMSGHTWLTNGSSSRSLAADGGGCSAPALEGRHKQQDGTVAPQSHADEAFQDSLGNLSAALPGLDLEHDSRSRLALHFGTGGSDVADASSSSSDDDDEMFLTAHGREDEWAQPPASSSRYGEGTSEEEEEDITASFLSCIAETQGVGISPAPVSSQQRPGVEGGLSGSIDGEPAGSLDRPDEQAQPEPDHDVTVEADEVAASTTTKTTAKHRRRKSVEFKDVVSYATVANKRTLSDDELFVLFYSAEEETSLRQELKSEIRAVKASPNPARTHPTFCARGVEHYFLPREGRQARLANQQHVIDSVLDEQHEQYCERGEIYDDAAIALVCIEASQGARVEALERGGSDETEAILIRREDDAASKLTDAVGTNRLALNGPILKGLRRASDEGALCA